MLASKVLIVSVSVLVTSHAALKVSLEYIDKSMECLSGSSEPSAKLIPA